MTNKETIYDEFIIVSIGYIRLFGKNNYIELYRKKVDCIYGNDYREISNIEIPLTGYEYIRYRYMNIHSGNIIDYTHSLHSDYKSLRKEELNLLKILKRLIKIHNLNNG